jgi:hypothetical protein
MPREAAPYSGGGVPFPATISEKPLTFDPHTSYPKRSEINGDARLETRDDSEAHPKTSGLSPDEIDRLSEYIRHFLGAEEHRPYYGQNPDELLRAMLDPDRISLPLRPIRQDEVQSLTEWKDVINWHGEIGKHYSSYHRNFLNRLDPALIQPLFSAKFLSGRHEKDLRDFLIFSLGKFPVLTEEEKTFLEGLDDRKPLLEQGVQIVAVRDFSSARALDEGTVVYRIELQRQGAAIAVFLKGEGEHWKKWMSRGKRISPKTELYEDYAYKVLAQLGMPVAASNFYYKEESDPDPWIGFTLMQEISGGESSEIFNLREDGKRFDLKPEYASYRERLVREWARSAAVFDLLHKGDRKIFSRDGIFFANYRIDLSAPESTERPAVKPLDHSKLFNPTNDSPVLDLKRFGYAELGILGALDDFENRRDDWFDRYQTAYLEMWGEI